jgi:methyl-galactoside transport system substrate-binding protein
MKNIRTKKKLLLLILAIGIISLLVMFFILPASEPSGPKYAFFLYDGDDTFIAEMMSYISSVISEEVLYVVNDAGNSQSVQNRQIVELIDSDVDIFIINTVDRLASSSIVERLSREGIPIIFFNREPLEAALTGNENVFYVGADTINLGVKQADIAAMYFTGELSGYQKEVGDTIRLVILKGEHGHQDAEKRTENCVNRLIELGFNVEVLGIRSANWRRQDAYETMRLLYAQFGDSIDLVFSNNDDMALGALDYLLGSGVFIEGRELNEQPFVIVSVDGTPVGLEAVNKGLILGTVHNNIARQSDAILTLADYIINERDIVTFPYPITNDHFIYIDGDIITRDNVMEYIRQGQQ